MPRGGFRKESLDNPGRPPMDPEKHRVSYNLRLPRPLVEWLREQERPATEIVEEALNRYIHYLKRRK